MIGFSFLPSWTGLFNPDLIYLFRHCGSVPILLRLWLLRGDWDHSFSSMTVNRFVNASTFLFTWLQIRILCGRQQCRNTYQGVYLYVHIFCQNWYFQSQTRLLTPLNSLTMPEDVKTEFESTAHYALNPGLFLENDRHGFMEVNPLLIKEYKKSTSLRRTKIDSVDCESIARSDACLCRIWLLRPTMQRSVEKARHTG